MKKAISRITREMASLLNLRSKLLQEIETLQSVSS